jgi:hypothetical protein
LGAAAGTATTAGSALVAGSAPVSDFDPLELELADFISAGSVSGFDPMSSQAASESKVAMTTTLENVLCMAR